MKKITKILAGFLTGALSLTVLIPATPAFAAARVTDGGLGVLAVVNSTRFPGSNVNWQRTTSANPGDLISFSIYYQNEGPDVARNVRVQISQPGSGALSTHTLGGVVSADNMGGQINGNASVTLSAPQTLTFNGTVQWERNTTGTGSAVANGVAVFNSTGLNLGDVAPGEFGSVVVGFLVGNQNNNVPPPQNNVNPIVQTGSVVSLSQTSAVVNGTINFQGVQGNASCFFDFGQGGFTSVSASQNISGNGTVTFTSTLNNLNPNTTYIFRANCVSNGQNFTGQQVQFTTPQNVVVNVDPLVSTGGASSISQNSELVNGSIDFRGTFANATCFFEFGPNGSLNSTSNSIGVSGSNFQNFSITLNNLNSNTTYSYRANCQVNGRTFQGGISTFTTNGQFNNNIDPFVTTGSASTISANAEFVNGTIDFRGSFQSGTCFFEYGPNGSLGNISSTQNVSGSNVQSFSATLNNLNQGSFYSYRANCQVNGRNFTGQILTFTTQGGQFNNNGFLTVTTNPATEVFTDSARLNGFVSTNGGAQSISGFFEYGLTTNFGNQTPVGNFGALTSSTFTSTALNLRPNTTYFFRAVAQNQNGQIARGATLSFTTRANSSVVVVAPAPLPVTPQVITPAASPIIISYGLDNVHPLPGDIVTYRIGWLNQGPVRLTNGILRITLPTGLTFLDSANGIARDGQTLIFPIGNLAVGANGSISFRSAVSSSVAIGTDLPMSIRIDFFNPTTGKNGDVTITGFTHVAPDNSTTVAISQPTTSTPTTVVVTQPTTDNSAATALLGNVGASFFPQTAVGWLFLLILAALIIALVRRAFVSGGNA